MIGRRGFITGLVSLVAAPTIVRAGSLMPVRTMLVEPYGIGPMISAIQGMDILDTFEMLDMNAVRAEIFKIMAVPPHWLVQQ
jgi:hypothetical protein